MSYKEDEKVMCGECERVGVPSTRFFPESAHFRGPIRYRTLRKPNTARNAGRCPISKFPPLSGGECGIATMAGIVPVPTKESRTMANKLDISKLSLDELRSLVAEASKILPQDTPAQKYFRPQLERAQMRVSDLEEKLAIAGRKGNEKKTPKEVENILEEERKAKAEKAASAQK